MTRFNIVRFLAALLLTVAGLQSASAAQDQAGSGAKSKPRPNVLFIAVDDLNDWIGCLGGHPDGQSPNIDALAASGMVFERAYCSAPACNPSRVAMMTGMRPASTGIYINPQPWRPVLPDAVTLPQHFRAGGYRVVGCGKIFHGGYEDDASWDEYQRKGGDPKPSKEVASDPHSHAGGIVWGELDVDDSAMNDHAMVDYAISQLQKPRDKPLFLACGLYRPHMPWQVPRAYYDLFPREKLTLPSVLDDDLADIPPAGVKMAAPQGDHATILKTDNWRHAVQAYLASIRFADAEVGRLLAALKDSPHADNTIVVLWGDHGWHLGEKHHWRKFSLWEEACRAPLIMRVPGITSPGGRCGRTVDFVDVYPTLCELCDLPVGPHLDGQSFASLLRDPSATWDHPALTTHGYQNHAVRSERYRYIRYANGGEELYDHESDPQEWKNLASDPALQSVIRHLAAHLPQKNADSAPVDNARASRRPSKPVGKSQ